MSLNYKGLDSADFQFPNQTHVYHGKVRDVYSIGDQLLVMVATDRISAFDHILPRLIPYKGEILSTIASRFLHETEDIIPNWLLGSPHPAVAVGYRCEPIKIEMVIRGYLVGHAWREYKAGKRILCGEPMPEGMVENEKFPEPIITPATKADSGHDEDISREEILSRGIVSEEVYAQLEDITRKLYARGCQAAADKGLILVDTKYEFGFFNGKIMLMDEVHTPDSSRYFYAGEYQKNLSEGKKQKHLSKEFVREWLMSKGFQGLDGQTMPTMNDENVEEIRDRYLELYQTIMGEPYQLANRLNNHQEIVENTTTFLESINT